MLKTKYKIRLLHTLKPKTQQHSVSVKVKNQTDTKFNFLNDIIGRAKQLKLTNRIKVVSQNFTKVDYCMR